MFKAVLLLLLGLVIMVVIQRNQTKVTSLQRGEKILAFGDSLTYGFGAKSGEGYPEKLSLSIGIPVINAGINGDTSLDGLKRISTLLNDPEIKLMLLCFGGNDILQKRSLSALKGNLKQIIRVAKERGVKVLLISVPDIGVFGLSPLPLYEALADEMEIPLLAGVLADILDQPKLKSDQVHPNVAGYTIFAKEIEKKLRALGYI